MSEINSYHDKVRTAGEDRLTCEAEFRTHLANERTFLAWCRTSISLLMFGFVVERLDIFMLMGGGKTGTPGAVPPELFMVSLFSFVLAGLITFVSGWRFIAVRRMIQRGEISTPVFPEALVIIAMVAIITVVIILLVR